MSKELPQEIMSYAIDIAGTFGLKLLTALIVIIIGRQLVKILLKVIKVALEKSKTEETVRIFIANLLNTIFSVIIFIAAINQLGVETTSIIALLGAAGLAIGLALQGSLSNFAAGILIVIFRPYKVGDYIEAGSNAGTVKDIQIFSTVLRTPDNKSIVVPNGSIMDGSITNYSGQSTRRIDIIASCSYEDDLKKKFSKLYWIMKSEYYLSRNPK